MFNEKYFINILKKNSKHRQEWLNAAYWFLKHEEIDYKLETQFFKQRPISFLMIYLVNLPTNILYILKKIKWNYQYDKVYRETEFLKKEIHRYENHTKLID